VIPSHTKSYFQTQGDLYFGAINTVDNPRLYIKSTGNVGIGTIAPGAKLDVRGPFGISTGGLKVIHDNGTQGLEFGYAGIKKTATNTAKNLYIDGADGGGNLLLETIAGGSVGIGTTTPSAKLEVSGGRVEFAMNTEAGPAQGTGVLEIANSLRFDSDEIITNSDTTLFLQHNNNGDLRVDSTTFVVDASANRVGVGTRWPSQKLEVAGNVKATKFIGDGSELTNLASGKWLGTGKIYYNGGNVGIGASSPGQKLHVSGNSLVTGKTYIGSTDTYFYRDLANRIATPDTFYVQSASPNTYLYSANTYLGAGSGDNILLRGNTFKWNQGVIQGDGKVGIGTTAPGQKLDVAGNVRATKFFGDGSGLTNLVGGRVSVYDNGRVDITTNRTGYALAVKNNRTAGDADGILVHIADSSPNSGDNYCRFDYSEGTCGEIQGNGSKGVSYTSRAGDYAEWLQKLDVDETFTTGDIVGVFGGKVTKNTSDARKVMVVSIAPIVLGNMPEENEEYLYEKIAFLGQVPVKVTGHVKKDDFIIPSGRGDGTGIAISPENMRIEDYEQVVGRAWSESKVDGLNIVLAMVGENLNGWTKSASEHKALISKLDRDNDELKAQYKTVMNENRELKDKLAALSDRQSAIEDMLLALTTDLPKEKVVKLDTSVGK
jgi:hypothetical protein